jgi:hypothetical protein
VQHIPSLLSSLGKNPRKLSPEESEQAAAHLADCNECRDYFAALGEESRQVLIRALSLPSRATPAPGVEARMAEEELLTWARRAVEWLDRDARRTLDTLEPTTLQRQELSIHEEHSGPLVLATLAVADAHVALESLVLRCAKRRAILSRNGELHRPEGVVPPEYFVDRIVEGTEIPRPVAEGIWRAVAILLVEGGTGLPDIRSRPGPGPDSVELLLEMDPAKRYAVAR